MHIMVCMWSFDHECALRRVSCVPMAVFMCMFQWQNYVPSHQDGVEAHTASVSGL